MRHTSSPVKTSRRASKASQKSTRAEERASKLRRASEDEKKARVRRPTPVSEDRSEDSSKQTEAPRRAFKGLILKTLTIQRLTGTPAIPPSGDSPAAAPKARASPCAQCCKARRASTISTVAPATQPC